MTKIKGNHQFKFGADIRYARNLRVPSDSNRTGVYAFNQQRHVRRRYSGGLDLATFLLGEVTQLEPLRQHQRRRRGTPASYVLSTARTPGASRPKFTFNYGLRWEVYFPEYVNGKDQGGFANIVQGVDRVAGEGGIGLNGNINNKWSYFAPRLGVAYQLNPKTVVRMGYGRSFDMGVFGSNFGHAVTQNLPVLASQIGAAGCRPATYRRPSHSMRGRRSSPSRRFRPMGCCRWRAGVLSGEFRGHWGRHSSCRAARSHTFVRHIQRLPTLDAWNATVQRQLNNSTSLEVAYIGNKGTHGFAGDGNTYNVNQPLDRGSIGTLPEPPQFHADYYPGTSTLLQPFNYSAYPDPSSTTGNLMCCSTDQGNYLGNDASSIYNALQIKVDRRFSHGLQFLTHYTFAHANKYDTNYYADSHPIRLRTRRSGPQ